MGFVDPNVSGARVRLRRSFEVGEAPAAGELRPGEVAVNAAGGLLFVGTLGGVAAAHSPVVFKAKAEAQAVVGTTLTNDSDLFVDLQANSTYRIEVAMAHSDETNQLCKLAVTKPSGAVVYGSIVAPTGAYGSTWSDGDTSYTADDGAKFVVHHLVIVTGATAGTANFQFAQNTAGVGVTRSAGSWLLAAKVA
jgi:hypothetical protein